MAELRLSQAGDFDNGENVGGADGELRGGCRSGVFQGTRGGGRGVSAATGSDKRDRHTLEIGSERRGLCVRRDGHVRQCVGHGDVVGGRCGWSRDRVDKLELQIYRKSLPPYRARSVLSPRRGRGGSWRSDGGGFGEVGGRRRSGRARRSSRTRGGRSPAYPAGGERPPRESQRRRLTSGWRVGACRSGSGGEVRCERVGLVR